MNESKPVDLEAVQKRADQARSICIVSIGLVDNKVNKICDDIDGLIAEVEALRERLEGKDVKPCNWEEDKNGNWDTDCGNCFVLEAETPSENEMKFCSYCGKPLTETRFSYEDEEEAKP